MYIDFLHHRIEPNWEKKNNEITERIDLLIKKLALLFAANKMQKTIELEDIETAIGMYDYSDETYDILAGIIGGSRSYEMEASCCCALKSSILQTN